MNRTRLVYDKIDISLLAGSTGQSFGLGLRQGECVGVKFIPFGDHSAVTHAIDIAVQNNGTDLVSATDFRDYDVSGGGYSDSFKPVRFDTSISAAQIKVLPTEALAANFKGQFVFAIKIKD